MIFDADCNYTVKNVFKQYWDKAKINYLETPRPRHGIVFIVSGRIDFSSKNGTVHGTGGDMVLLPKNSFYEAVIERTTDFLINFETDSIEITEPIKLLENAENKYIDMFNSIIDMSIKAPSSKFMMKSSFYMLLDNIVKDMEGFLKANEYFLEKAKVMLEEENLSVSEIAKKCGISQSGLRNSFVRTYGISPVQYKINVRINKAKFLLESTDMSVENISETLGFFDTAYFYKIFKKHTGFSPKNYVKSRSL